MKKKAPRPVLPPVVGKRSILQSLAAVLFGIAAITMVLLVHEAVSSGRLIWPSKVGPVRTTFMHVQPGLFWIGVGVYTTGAVLTALGAIALWRLAGPIRPTQPAPRPKRPPQDYPQYRKKKESSTVEPANRLPKRKRR